ncbi:MAG: single-stranded DNA-binding protein [Mycobacteriales bacterium]
MNEPQISLTGNLARDPELRFTPNGVPVADLRIGSTQRRRVGEQWEDGETLWFDVACWKQLAENVCASLKKGDRITVAGRLAQRSWARGDGSTGTTLVVDASAVGVDLGRYPVTVRKPVREGSAVEVFADRYLDAAGSDVAFDATTGELLDGDRVQGAALADEDELAA